MKFLAIQRIRHEVLMEKWTKLPTHRFRYFGKLEREETLKSTYHLAGHQRTMLIVNMDSDETLSRVIGEDPMFFEVDREICPSTTRENHEKQIRSCSWSGRF